MVETDPRPTPRPAPAPARESSEELLAEGAEVVRQGSTAVRAVLSTLALAGAALGGAGIHTFGSPSSRSFEELNKKVDHLVEVVDSMRSAETAAIARAQAERHEERIRELEHAGQETSLSLARILLEIESLKRTKEK